ncbi:SPOR domain-containing protein [Shewanella marinintestina]|uniref:SPOR domain-containing protein n=1 Tax=Shewanella marinintestina TaxID=190305 RepID=UPI00200D879E|nr:SPOR domain-containing protein [Shewanella marinintestina]MCL1145567.1 SPOR domain-containing protein [Shewanella marinintestina]
MSLSENRVRAMCIFYRRNIIFSLIGLSYFFSSITFANEQEQVIPFELAAELLEIKQQLADWDKLKPAIERLVHNEEDLALLISELSKISMLQHKPLKVVTPQEVVLPSPVINKVENTANNNKVTEIKNGHNAYGIHLSSYSNSNNLKAGWVSYKKRFHDLLVDGQPMQVDFVSKGKSFSRLVYGPYSSKKSALSICRLLKVEGQYCAVVEYKGERI